MRSGQSLLNRSVADPLRPNISNMMDLSQLSHGADTSTVIRDGDEKTS